MRSAKNSCLATPFPIIPSRYGACTRLLLCGHDYGFFNSFA